MSIPKKVRKQLHKRAESRCELCGQSAYRGSPTTNAHHRRNRSQGGPDVLSNLLLLCGSGTTGCHGAVTLLPKWAVENGYTIHGTSVPPAEAPVNLWLFTGRKRRVLLGDDGTVRDVPSLPKVGAWGETPGLGEGLDDDVWPLGEYPEVVL